MNIYSSSHFQTQLPEENTAVRNIIKKISLNLSSETQNNSTMHFSVKG